MNVVPIRRGLTVPVKPNRRPPLAPIPPAVFQEPVYRDGQPFEIEPEDDGDDAA